MRAGSKRVAFLLAMLLLIALASFAQRRFRGFGFGAREDGPHASFPAKGEFHFVRLEYTDLPQFHRGFGFASRDGSGTGWWLVDWPDSDEHFTQGLKRLTRIDVGEPLHMRLTDERMLEHPWLYATQTGWWGLSDLEVKKLREYLLRGGFLVTDDFWEEPQWEVFQETMNRVLPNQPITDIQESDPMMHVLYDIQDKDRTFIPGTRHLWPGPGGTSTVHQPPGTMPAWRAMYDDKNHMIVAANFNTDVGDAWEYADSPLYPEPMTALAYRYGINYLIYSMTH